MILLILGLCIISVCLLLSLICSCSSQRRFLPKSRRTLLVIAHPDDETMFFAPTIHGLLFSGSTVYVLCISTGNSDGLGAKRKYELAEALTVHGVSRNNLTILDYENFPDGLKVEWCKEELAKTILRHMQMLEADTVITFDENGVSTHPNHIGCFLALQYLYTNGLIPAGVQVFILESVSKWRKYVIPIDAVISSWHSTFLYISPPSVYITTWSAMLAHRSQLCWFRYLYMLFSRYILINTLKRIHGQPRRPVVRKTKTH